MAVLTGKTPEGLFKQIKPKAYVDNKSGTTTINPKYEGPGFLPYGGRKVKSTLFGSAATKAQGMANQSGRPTAFREEDYFGPTRTSLYPGKTGLKLPQQWQYEPKKTGIALADSMIKNGNL